MFSVDGTDNKGKMGANAILAVSLAVAKVDIIYTWNSDTGAASWVTRSLNHCVSICASPQSLTQTVFKLNYKWLETARKSRKWHVDYFKLPWSLDSGLTAFRNLSLVSLVFKPEPVTFAWDSMQQHFYLKRVFDLSNFCKCIISTSLNVRRLCARNLKAGNAQVTLIQEVRVCDLYLFALCFHSKKGI